MIGLGCHESCWSSWNIPRAFPEVEPSLPMTLVVTIVNEAKIVTQKTQQGREGHLTN